MDDPIRSFGFLLKALSRLYGQRFEQRARALGFTLPQSKALIYLSKNEGISQSQLAELSDIEPMSLVRILDRMEADGWMERRHDPADRRARRLYLRPKARPLRDQLQQVADLTLAEAFVGVSRARIELLFDLLGQIQGNLVGLPPIVVDPPAGAVQEIRDADGALAVTPSRRRVSTK